MLLLLRLQGKEISADTQKALTQISHFLAILSNDFKLDEAGRLFPDEDEQ